MAYVSVDSPIPQNSLMPPPAACVDRSNAAIELARQISQNGRLVLYGAVPTIASVAAVAPGAGVSASVLLPASEVARASILYGAVPVPDPSSGRPGGRPPVVVPLNWIPGTGTVCGPQTSAAPAVYQAPPAPAPAIVMPQPVPVSAAGTPPVYANLCWALRNSLVDADQFDPQEFVGLQLRCSQLGYAGNCPAPSAVTAWKLAQRSAGGLPRISVTAADLAAIGPAPDLTGVNCPGSYKLGGGMAGLSVGWGNAPLVDRPAGGGALAALSSWAENNRGLLGLLGVAALGLLAARAVEGKGRRF